MLSLLKELLQYENELMFKYDKKLLIKIRPSNWMMLVLTVFYVLSGIDLFPESLVHPWALGLIDDVVLITITGILIYADIGGILDEIRTIKIPKRDGKTKSIRKTKIPVEDRVNDDIPKPDPTSVDTVDNSILDTEAIDSAIGITDMVSFDSNNFVMDDVAASIFSGEYFDSDLE